MYKQRQTHTRELELFGKKIFEEISETVTIFPHKFRGKKERQPVLAETGTIIRKIFGYPVIKAHCTYDTDNFFLPNSLLHQ